MQHEYSFYIKCNSELFNIREKCFYKHTIINILVPLDIGNKRPAFKTSINYSVFILLKIC